MDSEKHPEKSPKRLTYKEKLNIMGLSKDEIQRRRQVVQLRKDVMEARDRWLRMLQNRHSLHLQSRLGKQIFFAKLDSEAEGERYIRKLARDWRTLDERVKALGTQTAAIARSLWLPPLLEAPTEIWLTHYESRSLTALSLPQARALAKKLHSDFLPDSNLEYFVSRPPNSDLTLHIRNKFDEVLSWRMNVAEWAICLLRPSEEEMRVGLRKRHPRPSAKRQRFKDRSLTPVIIHESTILYSADLEKTMDTNSNLSETKKPNFSGAADW